MQMTDSDGRSAQKEQTSGSSNLSFICYIVYLEVKYIDVHIRNA